MQLIDNIWEKNHYLLLVIATILLGACLLLLILLRFSTSRPQQQVQDTAAQSDANNCTAQKIACYPQFMKNKKIACGVLKSKIVDELLKREESPCKNIERKMVENQMDEACQMECVQ